VKEIFDAYRDEAAKLGKKTSPDDFALRRQVTIAATDKEARDIAEPRKAGFQRFIQVDPRVPAPGRAVLDTPSAHAFSIGDEEFITGSPQGVAEQAIAQCRDIGAGHFLSIFDREQRGDAMARIWDLFGNGVNPVLRRAEIG
jgi:alkanesulfonate monooxygenase SsuD/methylene tetrahydromethanopterin reductase-like flavin-dependent oxidoreductase (luciferase family)